MHPKRTSFGIRAQTGQAIYRYYRSYRSCRSFPLHDQDISGNIVLLICTYDLLRGTIENRTYGTHKNLPGIYLPIFTRNIWSQLLWPPAIARVATWGSYHLLSWDGSCTITEASEAKCVGGVYTHVIDGRIQGGRGVYPCQVWAQPYEHNRPSHPYNTGPEQVACLFSLPPPPRRPLFTIVPTHYQENPGSGWAVSSWRILTRR